MKRIIGIAIIGAVLFACDKVDNPYPPSYNTELDESLYPGDIEDYVENEWPDFNTITASEDRNALIEDFTGHNCSNCPEAATVAHDLHEANPNRVFVASVHAAPTGMSGFQAVVESQGYTVDFTNEHGLAFGEFFGQLAGSEFYGNPSGTISRSDVGGSLFLSSGSWSSAVNQILALPLKVKIKSQMNYFDATHGGFLHTQVEVDPDISNDLAMVVYMLEDTLIAPQNVNSTYTPDYIHRDIQRTNISEQTWGRILTEDLKNEEGLYELDYSVKVPNQLAPVGEEGGFNAENMHLLIWVYDTETYEVYQVVKETFE